LNTPPLSSLEPEERFSLDSPRRRPVGFRLPREKGWWSGSTG
jgi:hypothetical protein